MILGKGRNCDAGMGNYLRNVFEGVGGAGTESTGDWPLDKSSERTEDREL